MKCQEDEVNKVFQKYTKVVQICLGEKKKEYIYIPIFRSFLAFTNEHPWKPEGYIQVVTEI